MELRNHFRLALAYLFLVSLLGLILRHFQISDASINYNFILHTHSHIALLGWCYTALTTIIYKLYLADKSISTQYRRLFWFTQFTIFGMMLTFPFMGYAIASILFSTLFLFASYRFVYLFMIHTSIEQKKSNSYKWISIALWFMVISSLGPWVLGFIMNTVGGESPWYRNSIYFYLHFQYNGWFLVALFGILFKLLENKGIVFNEKIERMSYWSFVIGVVLTFFLSILWMKPHISFYILSGIGAIFQLIAFGYILQELRKLKEIIRKRILKITGLLLINVVVLFSLKLIAQFLGAIPQFAEVVSANKDLIIGYLHWVFLGVVTISIFAFSVQKGLMKISKPSFFFFFIGFLLTEGLLFYKAYKVWSNTLIHSNYYLLLFIVSFLLFSSIGIILIQQKKNR